MKWTVIYRPSAQDDLANLWLASADRQAIAHAADEIDRELARDPLNAGESRGNSRRLIVELPLSVIFDVQPDDNLVQVIAVFRWRTKEEG